MPDGNGQSEWQAETQRRLEALERAHRELEDSFIVMTQLETRMSRVVRQQGEWLANHEQRVAESEARWRRIDILMSEMTEKVNFMINREMRREGGPESK